MAVGNYLGENMDKQVIVCLSSGLTPQYRLDILRCLALPSGMSIQFRYGQALVGENLREELAANRLAGSVVLLAYVDYSEAYKQEGATCPVTPSVSWSLWMKDVLDRLCALAEMPKALASGSTTILKDNISWHYPFPAANTTPWQLEGTIQALARRGFADQVCVQNKTVVTNAFKGEDLNHYVPIFKRYDVPVLYNFRDGDMAWVPYNPKARMRALARVFPEGIRIPDYFFGKNIVHLPTTKCHIYTTTTGAMKNAFGGLLNTRRHYTHSWIHETLVDLLAIQKEIHSGLFAIMDGTTAGNRALMVRATGGVFVAGGIAPRILPFLQRGGFRLGASSITMQMTKNVLLTREKTLSRKLSSRPEPKYQWS
jgi:uncharacterized protein (DUF362 family)